MGSFSGQIVAGDVDVEVREDLFDHLFIKWGKAEFALPLPFAESLALRCVQTIAAHKARETPCNVTPLYAGCNGCARHPHAASS